MSRSIFFVCLGNICRSPLAEAAMRAEAGRAGFNLIVDSAGTGDWHVGNPPDRRAQAVAKKHGVDISNLRARQVRVEDFLRFDLIFALDQSDLKNHVALEPANSTASLRLLLDTVPGRGGEDVQDPYYGPASRFKGTWADVTAAARAIVTNLLSRSVHA
jgi:protein-tyrosine phosphatase